MSEGRRRVRRDETRAMFIDAGRAILSEEGLGTGGELLTLKRVSDRVHADNGIRFTNASIIGRIWENQSQFQTDVLTTVASNDSNAEVEESLNRTSPSRWRRSTGPYSISWDSGRATDSPSVSSPSRRRPSPRAAYCVTASIPSR